MLEIDWEKVPPENVETLKRLLDEWEADRESNPIAFFQPNSTAQRKFLASRTRTTAAIAGNQFGKTTSLVVRSLIQTLPKEYLAKWMREHKWWSKGPIYGRLVCPSYALVEQNLLPTFREWCPKQALRGGGFERGWDSQKKVLHFADGSFIDFLTYETDLDKFGGVRRHFVGYDEPPPRPLRDEGLGRIMRYGGFEMFAFTPLKANTGWLKREIFKQREDPDVTVVIGSIHDNNALDSAARDYFLAHLPNDLWRAARERGAFVDVGGQIYPEFERCVADNPFEPEFIRGLDIVVAIDPGIRNCGIVFTAFDRDNSEYVFDELLLQDSTPAQYAENIRKKLNRWGIREDVVQFVTDPAARQRGQVNAETVMSALSREQIYCNAGQNDVEAGIGQLRTRMQHGRFNVSPTCVGLRDEADEYAAEEPGEGRDDSHLTPVKGNDHRLDALRYATMERFWDPVVEDQAPQRNLGWRPGEPVKNLAMYRQRELEPAPMGFLG